MSIPNVAFQLLNPDVQAAAFPGDYTPGISHARQCPATVMSYLCQNAPHSLGRPLPAALRAAAYMTRHNLRRFAASPELHTVQIRLSLSKEIQKDADKKVALSDIIPSLTLPAPSVA